jgi:hypothetical protein
VSGLGAALAKCVAVTVAVRRPLRPEPNSGSRRGGRRAGSDGRSTVGRLLRDGDEQDHHRDGGPNHAPVVSGTAGDPRELGTGVLMTMKDPTAGQLLLCCKRRSRPRIAIPVEQEATTGHTSIQPAGTQFSGGSGHPGAGLNRVATFDPWQSHRWRWLRAGTPPSDRCMPSSHHAVASRRPMYQPFGAFSTIANKHA